MKQLKLIIAALFLISPFAANAGLINGSLTGGTGAGTVPEGWTLNLVSPDTTSAASQPFGFNVNPGDSPDGGTWVGLARNTTVFESFGQTITDFIVGTTYNLSWYVTNTGCCGNFNAAAEILFDLDGINVFTGATHTSDGVWYMDAFSFVATSTSHILDFRLTTGAQAYMGIDGISLSAAGVDPDPDPEPNGVPEPGTLALLGLGLAGMGMARRKKKA